MHARSPHERARKGDGKKGAERPSRPAADGLLHLHLNPLLAVLKHRLCHLEDVQLSLPNTKTNKRFFGALI